MFDSRKSLCWLGLHNMLSGEHVPQPAGVPCCTVMRKDNAVVEWVCAVLQATSAESAANGAATAKPGSGAAAAAAAGGAKSTTARLIETMPTPADQCAPGDLARACLACSVPALPVEVTFLQGMELPLLLEVGFAASHPACIGRLLYRELSTVMRSCMKGSALTPAGEAGRRARRRRRRGNVP